MASTFLAGLELREPNRRRTDSILALIDDFDRGIELAVPRKRSRDPR